MARGFGGETTAQEARGNEGLSSSDIAGGRQDAATSAMASGRDVDPGGGNDGSGGFLSNDYTPDFNRVSQIQDIMQAQETFNRSRGITNTNPFGRDNIFTKYLGIDPKNMDYSQNIPLNTRLSIANNQFSKFMNPQNKPGMVGYNPDFPTAGEGQLRAGVQSDGYMTAYGPVMGQARQQSTGEMIARGVMGLFGGLPGTALGQIGTQEYGLPGQPGFDSFNPNNPRAGGGILGALTGGVNPSQAADKAAQAVDSLRARFSPTLDPTTNAGIGSLTPASYETRADIRNRLSSTNPTSAGASIPSSNAGFSRVTRETLPDGRQIMVDENGAPIATMPSSMKSSSLNSTAGEQLAGGLFDSLFRDPNISPEAREILKEKGMTIDDLFAPKTSTPEPEKPNIMDLLQGITQTSALGGPTTLIT